MIDYAALYAALVKIEAGTERALVPGAREMAEAEWRDWWQRRHGLSSLMFQGLLHQMKDAARVEDVVRGVGTVHRALSLIAVLTEVGLAEVSATGDFTWKQPPFPQAPTPRKALLQALEARLSQVAPDVRWGQLRANALSSVHRVSWLLRDLPPFGRDVLFLGDDDFTSVVLAASMDGSVTVLDADERVLADIAGLARAENLTLATLQHDLRTPLPESYLRRFDTVCCDPIDDGSWLQCWLERAFEALTPVRGARLFLSISPLRLGDRFSGLLHFAFEHGFVLEHRVENLNTYPLAPTLDAFSRSFFPRIQNQPWAAAVEWAVHTDLLVFRYEGESRQLWPQAYRELRRGI